MAINSFKGRFGFLSNFSDAKVEIAGFVFQSVEHAYQAAKTNTAETYIRFSVVGGMTAAQSKKEGRKLELVSDWETRKFEVMYELLVQKFSDKNPELKKALLDTVGEELRESNYWHDNIWGSCTCDKCGDQGENRLGMMLMKIRRDLEEDRFIKVSYVLGEATSVGFVGSAQSTEEQLKRLGMVAGWAAATGKLGVSGGCKGADQQAANKFVQHGAEANFHVHMPWPQYKPDHVVPVGSTYDIWSNKYNKAAAIPFMVDPELKAYAEELAAQHVTGSWANRVDAAKATLGRNALIVMGCDVLVYCISNDSAGTAHDLRIAATLGTPTIDVGNDDTWRMVYEFLKWEKRDMEESRMDQERLEREED